MSFIILMGGISLALKAPVGGSGKFPHPHQLRNNHYCIEIVLRFAVCNQLLSLIILVMMPIKVPYHHQSVSL